MQGSNSVEESEAHPLMLCPVCLLKLKYCLQLDLTKRYENLVAACEARMGDNLFQKQTEWWSARLTYLATTTTDLPTTTCAGAICIPDPTHENGSTKNSSSDVSLTVTYSDGSKMEASAVKVKTALGHKATTIVM
jgi:hypothetical protein